MTLIRRFIFISTIILFIGSSIGPSLSGNQINDNGDELDQSQVSWSGDGWGSWNKTVRLAQGFIPTMKYLTRIELYMKKIDIPTVPTASLKISIRDTLYLPDEGDLTSVTINKSDIEDGMRWIEFDFEDIETIPGETYYIVFFETNGHIYKSDFFWGVGTMNPYSDGQAWYKSWPSGWCSLYSTYVKYPDFCFKTYGSNTEPLFSDLECLGHLNWNQVSPGSRVRGNFTVRNSGDPGSQLDWRIESGPEWGEWMFNPSSGEGLTPEDGDVNVEATMICPDIKESMFSGEVVVINEHDDTDVDSIEVTLSTPKQKVFDKVNIRLLEPYTMLSSLVQQMFNL